MNKFQEFLKSKNIDSLEGKSAEEVAGLYNEFNEIQRKALEKAIAEKAAKEDIDQLRTELLENTQKQMDQLNSILEKQGLVLKRMTDEGARPNKVKSIKDHLTENWDNIQQAIKEKKSFTLDLDLKVAGDMSTTGNTTGEIPQAFRETGLNVIATRETTFLNAMTFSGVDSDLVQWVYQANKDGAVAPVEEGAASPLIDFDLVVGSEDVKEVAAHITVTDRMLSDISFMEGEIKNELLREMLLEVEDQVYAGPGTGDNLNGIRTVATPFAAGSFALTVENANEVDVLSIALNQIKKADQPVIPGSTIVWVNSDTMTKLRVTKITSTDKRYVERLIDVAGTMTIDGIPIRETNLVTTGQYLITYTPYATVFQRGPISIEIGYNGTNFVERKKTVRAVWRGCVRVKHNDRTAFVRGVFATDAAALETA